MPPMLNIAAPTAAPPAAAPPSLAPGGSGSSRARTFDGVLSAKYPGHENSGKAATQDSSSAPSKGQPSKAHRPQHSASNSAASTGGPSAAAVPAQVPVVDAQTQPAQPSDSTSGALPKTSPTPGSATGAIAAATLSATSLVAATITGNAAPSTAAISTGVLTGAPGLGVLDSNPQPPALVVPPARKGMKDTQTQAQAEGATATTNSADPVGLSQQQASSSVAPNPQFEAVEMLAAQLSAGPAKLDAKTASQQPGSTAPATSIVSSLANLSGTNPILGISVDPVAAGPAASAPPSAMGPGAVLAPSAAVASVAVPTAPPQNSQQGSANVRKTSPVVDAAAPSGAVQVKFLSVPPAVAASDSSPSRAGTAHAEAQIAVPIATKQVAAPAPPSGTNHGSANGQNSDPKDSNSNSAAVAKAAGLAQASGGGPLHASADAPPQAPASAGPAATDAGTPPSVASPNANASIAARPSPLPAAAPSSLNDVVQASQLYHHVGGAEMHIAMSTDLLGSVDIHAVVRQSTVTATIGVQRPDVQTLLANDLPALQHALAEHSLHVEQISVLSGSTGNQMDLGRQTPQNQQGWRGALTASHSVGYNTDSRAPQISTDAAGAATAPASYAAGRLSIHV